MSKRKYLVPDEEPPEMDPEDEERFLHEEEEENPELEGGFFVGEETADTRTNAEIEQQG
jgi:hypothetical protein